MNGKPKQGIIGHRLSQAIRWVLLMVPILLLSACLSVGLNAARSGPVSLDEPVMAKGIDDQRNPVEPTTVFKPSDKRIYCTISIQGPEGVRLGARWYYGDKLISDQVINLGSQRRGASYVEMAPGEQFPVGDYRVEIYLVEKPLKVVTFNVTK